MLRRFLGLVALLAVSHAACIRAETNLWQLAKDASSIHRFATLFTAQDVHNYLTTDAGIDTAIEWCKAGGITHLYLEAHRDGYLAPREALVRARDRFQAAGFLVSGCVTTTILGKPSSGWGPEVCCYTDEPTQEHLQAIFEFAAAIFDEIIIDDYFFCDCTCAACNAARAAHRVTIGQKSYPVNGETWGDYHRALMLHVSEDRVIAAAKKINPKIRFIVKFPQWYDMYQERGYDVAGQTAAFDKTYVGTETRDYTNELHWGGTTQYEGYFLMRWLGEIGGEKCAGGWFDSFGTTPPYYLEQARQTILAGARESFLFCYGSLNPIGPFEFPPSMPWPTPTGKPDSAALRASLPELLDTAREVQRRQPVGVAIYKPINSYGGVDSRIFDYLGMVGIPLVPCHLFPTNAPAAIFTLQSFGDTNIASELADYIKTGRPTLVSAGLGKLLPSRIDLSAANVRVINMPRPLDYLLVQKEEPLDDLREPLLKAIHVSFKAPDMVGLYLFTPDAWVIENFGEQPVTAVLSGQTVKIAARNWVTHWK
jgi:hypothetical protein